MVTMYAYELFTIIPISLSYILMDSRLKGFSIESKTSKTEFGQRNYDRSKLEASHEQWLRATPLGPIIFCDLWI